MSSMAVTTGVVTGGVDTRSQTNDAAVVDHLGRELGDRELSTTAGYAALLAYGCGSFTRSLSDSPRPRRPSHPTDCSGRVSPECRKAVPAARLMRSLQSVTIGADEDTTPIPLTACRSFLLIRRGHGLLGKQCRRSEDQAAAS
jgi:hypothetical protein